MGAGIVAEMLVIFNQLTLTIVSESFINLAVMKASDRTSDMLYFVEGRVLECGCFNLRDFTEKGERQKRRGKNME
jgi:hypothetical protein